MLKKLFAIRSYAAADDKNTDPGTIIANNGATNVLIGLVGTTKFKNALGRIILPYNDSVCGKKEIPIIFSRTSPQGDTDYASLAVGSICMQQDISSEAVTANNLWIKQGSGASDWYKVVAVPDSASATARTAAAKEINVVGSNSGTGDYRAFYGKITLTHASAGSGDAVRGYILTTGGAQAMRGGQFTAEISTAGSVTGLAVGVEGHIAVASGLTLNAGTVACVDVETNNESSLLGVTDAAHIRIHDAGTYGMINIIQLGTIVGRSTNAAALGPYSFVTGGLTAAATAAKIAIRVKTPDGTFYLLGWDQSAISAT